MLRYSRFAPVNHAKSVAKPKETRSVSEGFFAFSNTRQLVSPPTPAPHVFPENATRQVERERTGTPSSHGFDLSPTRSG